MVGGRLIKKNEISSGVGKGLKEGGLIEIYS